MDNLVLQAEQAVTGAVHEVVAAVTGDAEKVAFAALGHAHNMLDALSADVSDARKSLEAAIIAFAKKIGG